MHLDAHHKLWIGQNPFDYLHLNNHTRYLRESTGQWEDWSDVEFLTGCGIAVEFEDKRTTEQLEKRYKPRDNFAGGF